MRLAPLLVLALALSACSTTGGGTHGGWSAGRAPAPSARPAAPPPPARTTPSEAPRAVRPAPPRPEAPAYALLMPVEGFPPSRLRDTFLEPRSGGRTHHAIDIGAPKGTPVVATTDGTVTQRHWNGLGGNTLYLRSADGRYDFYYAHLDVYEPGVDVGTRVRRGDRLGTVGATGNAIGPHLHFQVLDRRGGGRGTPVNPYSLLTSPALAASATE